MLFQEFNRLEHDRRGVTAMMVAVIFIPLILGITAFVVDMARIATVRERGQMVLDGAGLAAVQSADMMDVTAEANNFFRSNLPTDYADATFEAVSVSVNDDVYTLTVVGHVPFALAQIMGAGTGSNITLTTQVRRDRTNTEIALIMDTSYAMLQPTPSGASRIDSAKTAAHSLVNALYRNNETLPNTVVSLVSYSDGVRVEPSISNAWLKAPFVFPGSDFNGCLGPRNSPLDLTDDAPNGGNPNTLFDRYRGAFAIDNGVTVTTTDINGTVKIIPFTIQDLDDAVRVNFVDPNNLTATVGRIPSEIDYISEVGNAERMQITFSAPYIGPFINAVTGYTYDSFFQNENGGSSNPERGRWIAYDFANQPISANIFNGVPDGKLFDIPNVFTAANRAVYRVVIEPLDNGERDKYWGGGSILDNSDFRPFGFNYAAGRCALQPSRFFVAEKSTLNSLIDQLSVDGPTRSNRGLAWGWYALSGKWRGIIEPSNNVLPREPSKGLRKIAILMTQGSNVSGTDDAQFNAICANMKAQGITIYTVAFNAADAGVVSRLRTCASSPSYFFNAANTDDLNNAFTRIGQIITPVRITF